MGQERLAMEKVLSNMAMGNLPFTLINYSALSVTSVADGESTQLTLTFSAAHGLAAGDYIYVDFAATYDDGFYEIKSVPTTTTVKITGTYSSTTTASVYKKPVAGVGSYPKVYAFIGLKAVNGAQAKITATTKGNSYDSITTAMTIPAGDILWGTFEDFYVSEGMVLAYIMENDA